MAHNSINTAPFQNVAVKHWWQTPLHSQRSQVLKLLLLMRGNQRIMVKNISWYL